MKNKKGQTAIDGLSNLIVPLVGVGIVLIIGFLILSEAKDQSVNLADSSSVSNESITYNSNVFTALANSPFMELNCGDAFNGSDGVLIATAGNYSCGLGGINVSGAQWNTTILLSYDFKSKSNAFNATEEVQNATQDIPGWLPIIVITVIGAILLSLVAIFRGRK